MQQQRNDDSTQHMNDAKQMIAIFAKRMQTLANGATSTFTTKTQQQLPDTLTNDRLMDYEYEGIATQQTIYIWLRILYYILAIYCIILLWTQWTQTGGIIKKLIVTFIIMLIPSIIMPLLKFIIKNLKWVWGLFPTNIRMNIKPL